MHKLCRWTKEEKACSIKAMGLTAPIKMYHCTWLRLVDEWSRDKDGGHTIRYAIAERPMLHADLMVLFYRSGVMANRKFTLQE